MKREELERKIEEALLEEKENDLSSNLEILKDFFKRTPSSTQTFPDFEELYSQAASRSIIHRPNFRFGVLAAAAVLLASVWFGGRFLWDGNSPSNTPNATVLQITGESFLKSASSGDKIHLEKGSLIPSGEFVEVVDGGSIDLSLFPGESMRILGPASIFVQLSTDSQESEKVSVELKTGTLFAHIHKNKKTDGFQVKTDLAIYEVRGTKFQVEQHGGQMAEAMVSEGRLAVIHTEAGKETEPSGEQILEPGQKIHVSKGGFQRGLVSAEERKLMSGVFENLYVEELPRDKNKTYESQSQIYSEFHRLERVVLDNGEVVDGVIVDMDDSAMYVQTINGEKPVPRERVKEVIQLK